MAQLCYSCGKPIKNKSIIEFKGLGIFEEVPGDVMHKVLIIEEKEITHEQCSED